MLVLLTGGGSVLDQGPKLAICSNVTPLLTEATKRQLQLLSRLLFDRRYFYLSLSTDYRDFYRLLFDRRYFYLNLSIHYRDFYRIFLKYLDWSLDEV